ncbi:MAG TPA: ATP-binding protein [Solirubrobacterales bacterium]|nr:ATP-binding protein [Solirubrobacterales bacterium]
MKTSVSNPFRFGALALDDAFADRERETAELAADMRNGQDVVVFAPRRYGKSSLVWAATRAVVAEKTLVATIDLMTTPTKERLAAALASAVYQQIASPLERVRERALAPFRGLRVEPVVTVDPETGELSFSFSIARGEGDIDVTIERLLELPAELGAGRGRRTVLVIDEFQEIVEIDPNLPKLLRAAFQRQPEVSHVYLGSRRHVMQRIFNDANEPFWRSAKPIELGPIDPGPFAAFISERFAGSEREVAEETVARLIELTGGHPYATQELSYFLWEETGPGELASVEHLDLALTAVLRSENAHFSLLWEGASGVQKLLLQALAREPGRPYTNAYRNRHQLPPTATLQTALRALERREAIGRSAAGYRIAEPFFAAWLGRQEHQFGGVDA